MSKRYYYGDEIVHEYKGYIYRPEDDFEDDNIKRFHNVLFKIKNVYMYVDSVPLSPYEVCDEQTFQRWIEMGRPSRGILGGQSKEDHIKYWRKLFDGALDKILLGEDGKDN